MLTTTGDNVNETMMDDLMEALLNPASATEPAVDKCGMQVTVFVKSVTTKNHSTWSVLIKIRWSWLVAFSAALKS